MKKIFIHIDGIGNLYFDYIFFEFEMEPLLFTCVDKANNLYFCHCYKLLSEQKWFVIPTTIYIIKLLIEKSITIREVILTAKKVFDIKLDIDGKIIIENKIVNNNLPQKEVVLECDIDKAKCFFRI